MIDKKQECKCGYCYPEGGAIFVCNKAPHLLEIRKTRPYLIRLLSTLFLPRSISSEIHFTIESIPIGWIIVIISVLSNAIITLIN